MPTPHLLPFLAMIIALIAWTIPVPCFCAKCKQRCGKLNIIFPFYLKGTTFFDGKPGCGLRGYELECSENKLFITLSLQKYEVLELQAGALRIDPRIPNSCLGNNLKSFQLINTTYRLCSHNMLQLYDCNRTCGDCSIPLPVNQSLSQSLTGCTYSHPRCCESLEMSLFNNSPAIQLFDFTAGYQSLQNYSSYFGCSSFSSWAYSSSGRALSFLADYGLLLQWYIHGNCSSCSLNAICNNTAYGYTCKCSPHYSGDGYAAGVGCHLGTVPASERNGVMRRRSLIENAIMMSGIVAAAFSLGVVVVCGAVLLRRRRERLLLGRRIRGASFRNVDISGLNLLLSDLELFTHKQLDKATKGFASSEKLGNGASGAVYVAKLEDGRRVAVKRLHNFNSHICYQQTLNELSVLSAVKHRNLVRLLGCCTEFPEPLLVFEYVSNGTLAEHLQRERGDGLDWFTRLTIAAEAADALAYLHSMDPPILHRDVKSRNILLDHEFNTKVADFGLSRMGPTLSCDGSHISTIPQGTPGYLDPDYHQNFHLSNKSDVYSFGVVLIEIITALKPVDFSRKKREVNLAALAVAKIAAGCLDDIIDPFLQANKRFHVKAMVQRVAELAFRCLAYDKDARPPMTEVLEELLLIRGSTVAPVLDAPDDDDSDGSLWMDAHSLQEHGSASSFSLSETDRHALLAKSQPCASGVQGSKGITIPEDA